MRYLDTYMRAGVSCVWSRVEFKVPLTHKKYTMMRGRQRER